MALRRPDPRLYNRLFVLGFFYNFVMALNFTNNAIYPLYVRELGGGADTVGLFMGLASLAAVLGRPLIGPLIDRAGPRPVLLLGSLAMSLPSLGYLALLEAGLVPMVWVLRVVHGFGFGAHFAAFFTLAAQVAPEERRNEAIAMFGLSGILANLVGPFFGELVYDTSGLPAFFLMVTGFGLTGSLLVLMMKPPAQARGSSTPTLAGSFRLVLRPELLLVFVVAALFSVCFSAPQFFLGPLADERGIARFSLYFTAFAVSGVSVRLLGRRWGDRFGVRRILIPALASYAMGMLLLIPAHSGLLVIVAGLFSGLAHGIAFPAVQTLGFGRAPAGYGGSVIALITGMMDAGTMLAAFLLGFAAEQGGYVVPFYFAAAGALLAVLLITRSVLVDPERIRTQEAGPPPR